ncbi:ATP-binding protein [Bifidobacterium stellenboschense]|uniref:ATP-dependent DNA helicase RecQ n=2 Tax=Bifidobacterium stellenboschense TaxID=762211 RepID=A0A087DPR5_9BIFI|nr:ATP-binding protein [Bifidobacterium stellenboschense]
MDGNDMTMHGYMRAALKRFFGFDGFRPGQEAMALAAIEGRDALGIMPTGGGKSVCYQLPATRPGTFTLVISPLRALMRDQVAHLDAIGLPAASVDSDMTADEVGAVYARARSGGLRILYVAPERLANPDFLDFIAPMRISLIAVDEAHCVLKWGADFRDSYLHIGDFIDGLSERPPVMALTATATESQAGGIARLLRLEDPVRVRTGADRPNLRLAVVEAIPRERRRRIRDWAATHPGSGIVYLESCDGCERLAAGLRDAGVDAAAFHGKLADGRKRRIQDGFLAGSPRVIVATSAFGMGVDKPDVRWVLNDGPCKSLEAFWQEAGRAGRDGLPADSVLYWSPGDFRRQRGMIREAVRDAEESGNPDRIAAAHGLIPSLDAMSRYCAADRCLRAVVLDTLDGPAPYRRACGRCGACLHTPGTTHAAMGGRHGEPRRRTREERRQARARLDPRERAHVRARVIAYVDRLVDTYGHSVGADAIASALIGSTRRSVREQHLDRIEGYGGLPGFRKAAIRAVIDQLIAERTFAVGEYKTIIPAWMAGTVTTETEEEER